MILSALFLILPLLAEQVSAIPPPRRYSRSHFRRIYKQRDENGEFTGIPVASSTPDLKDLLPVQASSTISSDDPRITGNNTVPPSTSGIDDSVVSSLLAATSAFTDFTYTSYIPSATIAPSSSSASFTSSAVVAQSTAQGGSGGDAMDEIERMAKSKANAMIGQMLPTLTLEVVLEPTQVSTIVCILNQRRIH